SDEDPEEGGPAKTPPTRLPSASTITVAAPTRSVVLRLTPSLPPRVLAVPRVRVALIGRGDVREVGQERVLVRIDPVADRIVRREVAETEPCRRCRTQDRSVAAGDRAELAVGGVVCQPAAVR